MLGVETWRILGGWGSQNPGSVSTWGSINLNTACILWRTNTLFAILNFDAGYFGMGIMPNLMTTIAALIHLWCHIRFVNTSADFLHLQRRILLNERIESIHQRWTATVHRPSDTPCLLMHFHCPSLVSSCSIPFVSDFPDYPANCTTRRHRQISRVTVRSIRRRLWLLNPANCNRLVPHEDTPERAVFTACSVD